LEACAVPDLERVLKIVGAVVAFGGLALGGANYLATVRKDADSRNLEARKQYLTTQFTLYTDATRAAARLAAFDRDPNAGPSADRAAATRRFWELYWGELSMVENPEVEAAMVQMGNCLNGNCSGCRNSDLKQCALTIAHACRRSLAKSWNVPDWQY
jgi:hypothetical protein